MRTTALQYRPAFFPATDWDLPPGVISGCLFYTNAYGEGEMWSCLREPAERGKQAAGGTMQEAGSRWDDNELLEIWMYGEQWTAFHEPAYRQGYG